MGFAPLCRFAVLSALVSLYKDVENLRPESKEMAETWLKIYGDAKHVIFGVESAGN